MKIFISYSHKDEEWKNKLEKHLRVFELEGILESWSDRKIDTGEDWFLKIEEALNSSNIAILLITTDFLISDFILKKEVPTILKRRETENLIIFPIIIKPCNWQETEWLKEIQVQPKDAKPLSSYDNEKYEIESQLVEIAFKINNIFPISLKQLSKIKILFENLNISPSELKCVFDSILPRPNNFLFLTCHKEANLLFCMIDRLAMMLQTSEKKVPVLDFVIYIMNHYIDDSNTKTKVKTWLYETGKNFKLKKQDVNNLIEEKIELVCEQNSISYLLINLEEERKGTEKYQIQAWYFKNKENIKTLPRLFNDEDDKFWEGFKDKTFSLMELPYIVDRLLDNIYDYDSAITAKQLRIEFFLPQKLLFLEVDQWTLSQDRYDPIGSRYQITIRPKERYEKKYKRYLRNFRNCWDSDLLYKPPDSCKSFICQPNTHGLLEKLENGKLFFVLKFVPELKYLVNLIEEGTPFILWPRQINDEDEINKIEQLLACNTIDEIPENIRLERRKVIDDSSIDEKCITNHISLLWDDYDRPLPRSNYCKNSLSL